MIDFNFPLRKILNVLVVDDDAATRTTLSTFLKEEGYGVKTVEKEKQLFTFLIQKNIPDLILLDYHLSQTGGLEILRKLKQHPRLQLIPVLFITAYADPEDLLKARNAGAQGFIEKPFHFDPLFRQMELAMKGEFTTPPQTLKEAS